MSSLSSAPLDKLAMPARAVQAAPGNAARELVAPRSPEGRDHGADPGSRPPSHSTSVHCSVVVARTAADLAEHVPGWQLLAREAVEPNVFVEPWQFLPALEAFGDGKQSVFLLVYLQPAAADAPRRLIGFFPFEKVARLRGIPVRILKAWHHRLLFLATPLVHRDGAREAWAAVLDWMRTNPAEVNLIEYPLLLAEGPGHHAMIDALRAAKFLSLDVDRFTRAKLVPRSSADEGVLSISSKSSRREWRRQRRRLSEKGKLEFRCLRPGEPPGPWIDAFLNLEASGWKGHSGTAMAIAEEEALYFRRICTQGAERGQLRMFALYFDGAPIAMKCNFTNGSVSFAFKIAHDEAMRAYSPGALLELDFIAEAARDRSIELVDSCAVPENALFGRIYPERREIAHLLISPANRRGNTTLAIYSAIRSFKRSISPV